MQTDVTGNFQNAVAIPGVIIMLFAIYLMEMETARTLAFIQDFLSSIKSSDE